MAYYDSRIIIQAQKVRPVRQLVIRTNEHAHNLAKERRKNGFYIDCCITCSKNGLLYIALMLADSKVWSALRAVLRCYAAGETALHAYLITYEIHIVRNSHFSLLLLPLMIFFSLFLCCGCCCG